MAALASPEPCLLHQPYTGCLPRPRPPIHLSSFPPLSPLHLSLNSQPRPRFRRIRIVGESTSGSGNHGVEDLAAQLMERARAVAQTVAHSLEAAWHRAVQAGESADLQGKLLQVLKTVNMKVEEVGYDARKRAERLDRRYKISGKLQEMADFAGQQVQNIDQQFGIVQKVRTASSDFRRNWPMYRRQADNFLQTPLGKFCSTLVFLWLLLSGWLFRIVFLSMWVLPFAAPLVISAVARNSIVEGACPSCKRRFIGNRNQTVMCNFCRAVVWEPRQDFSKDKSDPSIIDIDIE